MASSIASSLIRRTLRRSLSSLSPICSRRCYSSSALVTHVSEVSSLQTLSHAKIPSFSSSPRFFSSKVKADETLKRVLESEIECVEQAEDVEVAAEDNFPFEIIDNPGEQTITLKRQFAGESIQVTVFMNLEEGMGEGEEEVDEDEKDSGDEENSDQLEPSLSLVVTIDKGTGKTLEICCCLDSGGLQIESLTLKRPEDSEEGAYEGPSFSDLDESLQKEFHKYLKARGIDKTHYEYLHEYMTKKEEKEYLVWLQNMKKFVEM